MRGEMICIGDELISGRVTDANTPYAASHLWPLGLGLAWVVMVGDEPAAIQEALTQAMTRCDYLIVSGGLGTTEDDLTAQEAAAFWGLPLVEHPEKIKQLEDMLRPRGRELTPEIRRMAQMPQGARPLDPKSAGFALNHGDGRPLYFLPGVPIEFRRIMDHTVLPELCARAGAGVVVSRQLTCYGLPESEVGRRLAGLTQATPGASLEQTLAGILTARGLTLALAESCTGGLIGHRLTQVPGSSDFLERGLVVYSNRAKQELLGVSAETLAAHGAVSAATAQEMAQGARINSGVDLGLAVTGIAGPTGGSEAKPVGTVFFGLSDVHGTQTFHSRFYGDRGMIKLQAAETALDLLRRHLEEHATVRGA